MEEPEVCTCHKYSHDRENNRAANRNPTRCGEERYGRQQDKGKGDGVVLQDVRPLEHRE